MTGVSSLGHGLIPPNGDASKPPEFLYKYQPVSRESLGNLASRSVWLSAPKAFNDPFDCVVRTGLPKVDDGQWSRIYNLARLAKNIRGNLAPDEFDAIYWRNDQPTDGFKRKIFQEWNDELAEAMQVRGLMGVASFSAVRDDVLLWSHYADRHQGFCLRFDGSAEPFKLAHKVEYDDKSPLKGTASVLEEEARNVGSEMSINLLTTKHDRWSYEQEWRLLSLTADRPLHYYSGTLKRIYFGSEMPESHKGILIQMLSPESYEFYQMRQVVGTFEIQAAPL